MKKPHTQLLGSSRHGKEKKKPTAARFQNPIDRAPARSDNTTATEAMGDICTTWNIEDVWRRQNPTAREFTYRKQNNGEQSKSRLDRIYVKKALTKRTYNWNMKPSAVPTDHWMVQVKCAPKEAPYIGKGRWTWPLHLIDNEALLHKIEECGIKLLAEINRNRLERSERQTENPQTLWKKFKESINRLAKETVVNTYHKINSRIRKLDLDTNSEVSVNEAFLANELTHLKKRKAKNRRAVLKTKLATQGEKLGGSWSNLSKEKKPRDIIYKLKIPNKTPTQYERCSKRMTELVRKYHEDQQLDNTPQQEDDTERENLIRNILRSIPEGQCIQD
jgi:hypothetical protein